MRLFHFMTMAWALTLGSRAALADGPMTWQACVDEVLRNNSSLQDAQKAIDKARLDRQAAFKNFWPSLTANVSDGRSWNGGPDAGLAPNALIQSPPVGAGAMATGFFDDWRPAHDYSYGLSLRQELFNGYRDSANISVQDADIRRAAATARKTAAEVRAEVATAFYGLLYAQRLIDLNQSVVKRRQENVRLVDLRFQGGQENKGAFLRMKALLHEAEFALTQAQRSLDVMSQELQNLMGGSGTGRLTVSGEFPDSRTVPTVDIAEAVASSADHESFAAQIAAASAQMSVALCRGLANFRALGPERRNPCYGR